MILIFQKPRRLKMGNKCLKFDKWASHTACIGEDDQNNQHYHKRNNQND